MELPRDCLSHIRSLSANICGTEAPDCPISQVSFGHRTADAKDATCTWLCVKSCCSPSVNSCGFTNVRPLSLSIDAHLNGGQGEWRWGCYHKELWGLLRHAADPGTLKRFFSLVHIWSVTAPLTCEMMVSQLP
eukprot:693724-Rhodomonas_salina.1